MRLLLAYVVTAVLSVVAGAAAFTGNPLDAVPFTFNYACDIDVHDGYGYVPGHIRFNTPSIKDATEIYIEQGSVTGDGDPITWMRTWQQGVLSLKSTTRRGNWLIFKVEGVEAYDYFTEVKVVPIDHQPVRDPDTGRPIEACNKTDIDIVSLQFDATSPTLDTAAKRRAN